MSKNAMPVFPFKSFVIPHLMLMSLIHFAFILFTVLENIIISFIYMGCTIFPAPLIKETAFSLLIVIPPLDL